MYYTLLLQYHLQIDICFILANQQQTLNWYTNSESILDYIDRVIYISANDTKYACVAENSGLNELDIN